MRTKLIALKAITWNSFQYKAPHGEASSSGYVSVHGFGHEEWNNDPSRIINDERYFHTEFKPKMESFGVNGNLGILMFANHQGADYLVGVACNVYANDDATMNSAARKFGLHKIARSLWELEPVQQRHKSFANFKKHWNENYDYIKWRCQKQFFIWLDIPVQIFPIDFTEKSCLLHRHSTFQTIRADDAVIVLTKRANVGKRHPVIKWLTSGEFEQPPVTKSSQTNKKSGTSKGSASSTTEAYIRYVQAQEVKVSPEHSRLQAQFTEYLLRHTAKDITSDVNRVDVRYTSSSGHTVLVEIKPATTAEARYAIRLAMGQLLDYRHREKATLDMLIVISEKPRPTDLSLALDNGFGVAYKIGSTFEEVWPDRE